MIISFHVMATTEILEKIKSLNIHLHESPDKQDNETYTLLLQIIEMQFEEIKILKAENQKLRDENNHLKGEQGKPKIPSNTKKQPVDISSEKERKRLELPKPKKSKKNYPR
ncbi:MAG TPA: hypothetical protein VFC41_09005 [Anaerovoracaceae bacterium]|nr:hypothetical protein [Anaerovoracaceae bacterium]